MLWIVLRDATYFMINFSLLWKILHLQLFSNRKISILFMFQDFSDLHNQEMRPAIIFQNFRLQILKISRSLISECNEKNYNFTKNSGIPSIKNNFIILSIENFQLERCIFTFVLSNFNFSNAFHTYSSNVRDFLVNFPNLISCKLVVNP